MNRVVKFIQNGFNKVMSKSKGKDNIKQTNQVFNWKDNRRFEN